MARHELIEMARDNIGHAQAGTIAQEADVSIRKLPDGKKLARLLGDRVDVQGGLTKLKHEIDRGFLLDVVV